MAKTGKVRNGRTEADRKAFYQQPWVKRVMQGNYSAFARLLFMRIASFGVAGCWMENVTLAEEFGTTERYIQMLLTELWNGHELWITSWLGSKRKIWAVRNPEVVAMAEARYQIQRREGKVKDKDDFYRKTKSRGFVTPKKPSG